MSMRAPEITVLMAVYNGERFLRPAIESILSQTFTNFEFLIIDDGSTDTTQDILRSYPDSRMRLIVHTQNTGLTYSLNHGLKLARGEYIARQDADDISARERLAQQMDFCRRYPNSGLVGTYYEIIDQAGHVLKRVTLPSTNTDIQKQLIKATQFCHGSVLFKKEVIDRIGHYRTEARTAEDYDLWLRIAEYFQVYNIPEYLYQWRVNLNGVSINKRPEQLLYTSFVQHLALERRSSGVDSLMTNDSRQIQDVLATLMLPSNKHHSGAYHSYLRGMFLYETGQELHALRYFWRSLFSRTLCKQSGLIILKIVLKACLPRRMIDWMKTIVTHENNN